MQENVRNMIKLGFSEHFQEYNQTPENTFQKIFWNATKHWKIFSFPENSISEKYFTRTKHSLIEIFYMVNGMPYWHPERLHEH